MLTAFAVGMGVIAFCVIGAGAIAFVVLWLWAKEFQH